MSLAAPSSSSILGFTAIEFMVVIALVAILASSAWPDLRALLERQRLRQAATDMQAAIHLARLEALRRGGQVTLRKAASADCAAGPANDWHCGWIVFADDNGNGLHDGDEELLQAWPPLATGIGVTVHGAAPHTHMHVNRWGRLGSLGILRVVLRGRGATAASVIALCVSAGGRIQTRNGSDKC